AVIALGFSPRWNALTAWLQSPAPAHAWARLGGAALFLGAFAFILLARQFLAGYFADLHIPTLWLAAWGSLLGAAGLRLLTRQPWAFALAGMLLTAGVLAKAVSLSTSISDSPLSLGWSEASRFYYASLFFAERLYGQPLPLSILHPTRYFLQSFPFIFDGLSIEAHRAWQVFLWLALTAGAGWALVQRLGIRPRFAAWLAGAWFFLYLFQGAVYYHLLVMVIVVLLGASTRRPWQTLLVVLLASLWAGVSRVNWFPVPALLATALYLLEQPVGRERHWLRYITWPAIWFAAGVAAALAAQSAYIFLSGNASNAEAFASSFTSDLLWYRLWPSPTYPLGTIPGIVIVSAPLVAVLAACLRGRLGDWHPIRLVGLGSILLVLLGGGMVVSVKIGGGGDLHNMDAFITLLGVVTAVAFLGRAVPDAGEPTPARPWLAVIAAVLIPVYFSLQAYNPVFTPRSDYDDFVVAEIRAVLEPAAAQGKQSLLITQRQLITFGTVNIPLAPDYEVVSLMEMAMSRNEKVLGQFYRDLDERRYAYIVVSPLFLAYKGADSPFGEENDVWVRYVAAHLACEYEPINTFEAAQVQILAPKVPNPNCPAQP
ncbi:MAG: hypothetical protein WHV44_12125, partial [Anaerolineales bacterium]